MMSSVGNKVAHGGPIVAVLGAVDNVVMFFVAAAVGVAVTVLMVNFLKKDVEPEPAVAVAGDAGSGERNERAQVEVDTTSDKVNDEVATEEISKLTDITNLDLIELDLASTTRDDVIDELIEKFSDSGVLDSKDVFREAILNRESQSTTGLGMNIAIPHGKSNTVKRPAVAFGMKRDGVDWKSLDGTDAKLIFMIAVPEASAGDAHLKILQMLSRKLMDEEFREQLLSANSKEEAYELLNTIS